MWVIINQIVSPNNFYVKALPSFECEIPPTGTYVEIFDPKQVAQFLNVVEPLGYGVTNP